MRDSCGLRLFAEISAIFVITPIFHATAPIHLPELPELLRSRRNIIVSRQADFSVAHLKNLIKYSVAYSQPPYATFHRDF